MSTRIRVPCVLLAAALLASCGRTPADTTGTTGAGRSGAVFTLTSQAFTDGGRIPTEYASERAGGQNRSLPLSWSGAPEGTRGYVLAFVDHAPVAHMWVHWTVVGIPAETTSLRAGASGTGAMPPGARELTNTGGARGYGGPAPPSGSGDHPYVVTVYALSSADVTLPPQPTAAEIDRAVAGNVLDTAELTGMYAR